MRGHLLFCVWLALVACGCRPTPPAERTYPLRGQILKVYDNRLEAQIKHDEIKGFMPAMTMPYKMKTASLLDGLQAGDLVSATLVVTSNDAFLTAVSKVGTAPLEEAPKAEAPAASDLLAPGDPVPNARFVDQDGKSLDLRSFKGVTLVVTFIYTSCPFPNFCPLMDRHFTAIQQTLATDATLRGVHLVSVSFDPATDTPAVLLKHAQELKADPKRWTFLTGEQADIDPFARKFGVSIARTGTEAKDISHTLRTAIIDPEGKLVKIYIGNEWTPKQVVADLKRGGHPS